MLVALAALAAVWLVLDVGFYARDRIVDTPVYQRYGDAMEAGGVPYRDFQPEYPPAALPVFALPSLAGNYEQTFEWLMLVCAAAAVVAVAVALGALGAGTGTLVAALLFVALSPLALGSVVLSRYDLWPAALTVAALAAVLSGRAVVGSATLGLAVAAKLYPAVLAPLVAVWLWRRQGPRAAFAGAAAFIAILAACFLPFAVLAPGGLEASFDRQLSRPLQIESLGSALLIAAGAEVEVVTSHGSQNVGGEFGRWVGAAATGLQAAAVIAVWVGFADGPMTRARLARFAAAAVLAFVALGKVLSPQFLIWLVPLVPLVAGRRGLAASGLLGLALVLTQLWFPFRYWDLPRELDGTVVALVLARDLVLVAALGVLAWPRRAS